MGLTIHYGFTREKMPENLLKRAEEKAKKLGWKILQRSWNKLEVHPDENCESIILHFHQAKTIKAREGWDLEKSQLEGKHSEDEDWYAGGFVKTHYAGYKVHIEVAEFLRWFGSYCEKKEVYDESGYYEIGYSEEEVERMKEYLNDYNKSLSSLASKLKDVFGSENVVSGGDL